MGLTDAELTIMRDTIALLMPDTCIIYSVTNTPDGEGGVTEARSTEYAEIPCRLDVVQGREQVAGGAMQPYTSYMLSVAYDTDLLPSYIVEHDDVEYAVKSINRSQSWKAVVRVELERL
jgi:hypothetical protein